MRIISYSRVSTGKQQASGLGLEAQRTSIEAFAERSGSEILEHYVEVESGRKDDRPELEKALRHARVTGARIVIARLDRLSRNAAFLMNLQSSGVEFTACDMPHANETTVGIMAVMAQAESELISVRTKEAMQAAKKKGRVYGNPNGARALRLADKGNKDALKAIKHRADARASDLSDVLSHIASEGHVTLTAQANELNARGIRTARGGRWHPSSVSNLRRRIEGLHATT
ncbi:MAG: recombinase family protein [Pseudomonadota bacterium]